MKTPFIRRGISFVLIITFFSGVVLPAPPALAEKIKDGERAKQLKDYITAAYTKYVKLLSAGFSADTAECTAVFNGYKKAVSGYTLFKNVNTFQESPR